MMHSLRELLRLMRYAQASLSVQHYQRDIERAKTGLAKAFDARDQAAADLRIYESPMRDSEPPSFLVKHSDDQPPHKPTLVAVPKRRRTPRIFGEAS